eukprot:gene11150-8509_t
MGVFVEGQRVVVRDASHAQHPSDYADVFGERNWIGGTHHPKNIALLVYLVEGQGQEYFIMGGRGLALCSAVAELPSGPSNVLLITGSSAPELRPGEWAAWDT